MVPHLDGIAGDLHLVLPICSRPEAGDLSDGVDHLVKVLCCNEKRINQLINIYKRRTRKFVKYIQVMTKIHRMEFKQSLTDDDLLHTIHLHVDL